MLPVTDHAARRLPGVPNGTGQLRAVPRGAAASRVGLFYLSGAAGLPPDPPLYILPGLPVGLLPVSAALALTASNRVSAARTLPWTADPPSQPSYPIPMGGTQVGRLLFLPNLSSLSQSLRLTKQLHQLTSGSNPKN